MWPKSRVQSQRQASACAGDGGVVCHVIRTGLLGVPLIVRSTPLGFELFYVLGAKEPYAARCPQGRETSSPFIEPHSVRSHAQELGDIVGGEKVAHMGFSSPSSRLQHPDTTNAEYSMYINI